METVSSFPAILLALKTRILRVVTRRGSQARNVALFSPAFRSLAASTSETTAGVAGIYGTVGCAMNY